MPTDPVCGIEFDESSLQLAIVQKYAVCKWLRYYFATNQSAFFKKIA